MRTDARASKPPASTYHMQTRSSMHLLLVVFFVARGGPCCERITTPTRPVNLGKRPWRNRCPTRHRHRSTPPQRHPNLSIPRPPPPARPATRPPGPAPPPRLAAPARRKPKRRHPRAQPAAWGPPRRLLLLLLLAQAATLLRRPSPPQLRGLRRRLLPPPLPWRPRVQVRVRGFGGWLRLLLSRVGVDVIDVAAAGWCRRPLWARRGGVVLLVTSLDGFGDDADRASFRSLLARA